MSDNPDWVFDNECPKCGEEKHLQALVDVGEKSVTSEGDIETTPLEASLACGVGVVDGEITGCGHEWDWENDGK